MLLLLSLGLLLFGIRAVRLNGGLGGGGKLGKLLLKPAKQHFLIGLAGGLLGLLDGFEGFLQKIRQFLVLGFCRGEIHHNILAKNLDLDVAACNGIFQRLDDLFGSFGLTAILILLALFHIEIRLGDIGGLLRHVLGDGWRGGRAEVQRQYGRAFWLLDDRDDTLHTKGVLQRARNLLEFRDVEFGEGQDQNEEGHQQRRHVGEGGHPGRRTDRRAFRAFFLFLLLYLFFDGFVHLSVSRTCPLLSGELTLGQAAASFSCSFGGRLDRS